MPTTGVVIIGRNEGERLRRCLASVAGNGRPVVYVDSNSNDGSPALAASMQAEVVALDMSIPFSAARARNAGLERLLSIQPHVEFVQFIDGDCEMQPEWIPTAEATMAQRPDAVAVAGRLRERFPEKSLYNRLADIEWDTPPGEVKSCGGISMMRVAALQAVGGFDPTVVAGEEPELCQRLRERGGKVLRLAEEMALHDSAMFHFSQWWKRATRSGYGAMDVATRFRKGKDGLFVNQIRSARLWAIGVPIAAVIVGLILGWIFDPMRGLVAAMLVAGVVPLQAFRLAWRARRRITRPADCLAYGTLTVVSKWANVLGQYRYHRDRAAGQTTRLIDYKAPIKN